MSKIRISVLCPTRKRMALMRRVAEKCFETCYDAEQIELIFGIDDDDTESIEMAQALQKELAPNNIEYIVWSRNKFIFSDLINQCSKPGKGEIFNIMSDDAIHNSKDWDKIALEIFDSHSDKIILLQTSGGANQNTGFPFMHRNWRDAAGYLLSPIFQGDWGDYWLTDVIRGLPGNRFVFSTDIEIKHLHAEWGHMEKDETYHEHYKERQAQEALPREQHPYHGIEGTRLKNLEIQKLNNFIKNYNK
tara:strand:- start:12012 stop:12752 length:741 start_codon:yes stop_codon:yes gene_type:complete